MTIAELSPFIRQQVLLLSSDKPGEVAAAVRRITKRLQRAGSWHDLADALEGAGNVTELRRPTCWSDVPGFLAEQTDDLSPRDRELPPCAT